MTPDSAPETPPAPTRRPAAEQEIAYRPDIDGLRALAVIAVLLYHAYPAALPGGFVGVDVFFVISGYLISGNIRRRLEARSFSFADFYARRIRRIFPALCVVLPACLAYGFVILLPIELAKLGTDVAGGAAFVSNLLLWHEAGYFDRAAIAKPLLHLWSLGIEEQFYIVWPLVLFLLHRRRYAPLVLALIGTASLGFSLAIVSHARVEDFYSPLTRFWELDAGALLAFLRPATSRAGGARGTDLASLLGLGLIGLAALTFDRHMAFPGGLVLVPVIGALLLIAVGPAALVNRGLLSRRAAVFVGLISYPLYLWHWPLISFAAIIDEGRPLKPLLALILLLVAFLLAWVIWRWVETPLRFGRRRKRNTLGLVAAMVVTGAVGLIVARADGFPGRFPPLPALSVARINAAINAGVFRPTRAMRTRHQDGIVISRLGSGVPGAMFLGDSVIYQYGPRVQALLDQGRLRRQVTFVAGASCAPVPGVERRDLYAFCNHLTEVAGRVLGSGRIGPVVIGANWSGYASPTMFIRRHGSLLRLGTPAGTAAFYANLRDYVARLRRGGHPVYLVAEPAESLRFNPVTMIRRTPFGFKVDRDVLRGVPIATLRRAATPVNRNLRAIAAATGAVLLDPLADVCGAGPICSAFTRDGSPKFVDGLHLRPGFVARRLRLFDGLLTGRFPAAGMDLSPASPDSRFAPALLARSPAAAPGRPPP